MEYKFKNKTLEGIFNKNIKINDSQPFNEKVQKEIISNLINFMKEFDLQISARMLNTITKVEDINDYIINYAQLTGRDYKELAKKMESIEWEVIANGLKQIKTEKTINKRFTIYFGMAGAGKSTAAAKIAKDNVIMHENVTPKELLFNFNFKEGQPGFYESSFAKAMREGYTILLDEINLAPFETIRFMQGLLDNKEEVTVDGVTFTIHPDFHVIGTMNEEVLGVDFFLPEPLIDRAADLKRFTLSVDTLMEYAL